MKKNYFNWYQYFIDNSGQDPLNLQVPDNSIIIAIGDIHEHLKLFDQLVGKLNPLLDKNENFYLISLGDLYDKGEGVESANSIFNFFKNSSFSRHDFLVKGNHEAKKIRKKDRNTPFYDLEKLPNVLSFVYPSGFRLTCLHGGVTPNHSWNDLKYSEEVLYVRTVDENGKMIKLNWIVNECGEKELKPEKSNGSIWHEKYDGRFGYIASGHDPQLDGVAKFYKNSCNLDSGVYETKILTAAVFTKDGHQQTITVRG